MAIVLDKIKWLYHEFGFSSVIKTGKDAWIIILQRSPRMFAYGTNSLILGMDRGWISSLFVVLKLVFSIIFCLAGFYGLPDRSVYDADACWRCDSGHISHADCRQDRTTKD